MAGAGNWQRWFPDDRAHALYERIYPQGMHLAQLAEDERDLVLRWKAPRFTEDKDGVVFPLVPVLTDEDQSELAGWFARATEQAASLVAEHIGEYRDLAHDLASQRRGPTDCLLTILLCAHTLDLGTLDQLHGGVLGPPPDRAGSGHYFFWGRTARDDQTCDFGVNSYNILGGFALCVLHSRRVHRAAPPQPTMTIPVLDAAAMERVQRACGPVSEGLAGVFSINVALLEDLIPRCSFATCSRPDYLCMLFHIGYGHLASALVKAGLLPAFPDRADDSWGIWIRPLE